MKVSVTKKQRCPLWIWSVSSEWWADRCGEQAALVSLHSFRADRTALYLYTLSKTASHVMKLCSAAPPAACHWSPLWIGTLFWTTDAERNSRLLRCRYVSEATEATKLVTCCLKTERQGATLRGMLEIACYFKWAEMFECRHSRLLWWCSGACDCRCNISQQSNKDSSNSHLTHLNPFKFDLSWSPSKVTTVKSSVLLIYTFIHTLLDLYNMYTNLSRYI